MYNKLFTKILDSSIWLECESTRIVWLTFIAAMDEDGFAQFASVPNLAHRARVTLEACERAVNVLESPDELSADKDHEGRRIERVPGGWMVLNAPKYRDLVTRAIQRERTRLRVQRYRTKKACNADVTPANDLVTQSEAYTDTKAEASPHTGESGASAPAPKRFSKPSLDEVKLSAEKAGLPDAEAVKFFNHYESNGWKVGRNPMKSLPHAIANWRCRWEENRKPTGPKPAEQGQLQEVINVPSL